MLTSADASDAMTRVAACLPYADLTAVTRCCRATQDRDASAFYRAWAARSMLVLPPESRVTHHVLSTVTTVNAVLVPHSRWLDVVLADEGLAPRLARVQRLLIPRYRFFLAKTPEAIDLAAIAAAFPSTTRLCIERLENVQDVGEINCFRHLRQLEVSADKTTSECTISIPTLEELTLTRIDIHNSEAMRTLTNLRSLELLEVLYIPELTFLRHLPLLNELNLGKAHLPRAAVADLLQIAARLTRFECGKIESVWSHENDNTARLASVFTKLERLRIGHAKLHDLSSLALIRTLRDLELDEVATADISPLQQLVHLERLWFSSPERIDLAPLATLPRLVSLKRSPLVSCSLPRADTISFPHLRVFQGPYKTVTRLCDLEWLDSLTVQLDFSNEEANLSNVRAPRLRSLELYFEHLGDGNLPFPRLRELRVASYSRRKQTSLIDHMPRLRQLERLELWQCQIHSLAGVEEFPQLRKLLVSEDPTISVNLDLSPLARLPRLEILVVMNCSIVDVTPLTHMPSLRVVKLPEDADCCPLVVAYHAVRLRLQGAPAAVELREVVHDSISCLWGTHYTSSRVQFQLSAMAAREASRHGNILE